jgi:hypothetical protein
MNLAEALHRIGLAIFGAAVATVVYFRSVSAERPRRLCRCRASNPNSQVEVEQGEAQRLRATVRDFSIKFARSLAYGDGSQKMFEVQITVKQSRRAHVRRHRR